MKCDEVVSKISFLPRAELPYEDRQLILDHIQFCAGCKKEYQEYLQMFYLIDGRAERSIPENLLTNFSSEIMEKIENPDRNKMIFNKIIWYAAAVLILFIIILNPFTKNEDSIQSGKNLSHVSITELINREDWQTIVQKIKKNDIPEELISVSFLLSKFSDIDTELANHTLTASFGKNTKEFNELIQMLMDYQRFSADISTIDISNYLKNKKGDAS